MPGERRRATLAAIVLVVAIAFAFLVNTPGARAADATPENELTVLTDNSRAAAGLPSFASAPDLAAVAAQQAARMAARDAIYHNPDLGTDVTGWQEVGENVGAGASADQVHEAFMNSPHHRDNILSSVYTEVGFGTAVGSDGRLYIAEVFRLPEAQAAPAPVADPAPEPPADPTETLAPAPAPDAAPAPAPAPVVTAPAPVPVTAPAPAAPVVARQADLTDRRPQLVVSYRSVPVAARHAVSFVAWMAALLAQAVLIAHMLTFWRRYRIGSGSYVAASG